MGYDPDFPVLPVYLGNLSCLVLHQLESFDSPLCLTCLIARFNVQQLNTFDQVGAVAGEATILIQ